MKTMKNISDVLSEIRAQEPTAAEIEQAAARVRQRLFPSAQTNAVAGGALRDCAGFREIMPAALTRSLDAAHQLLLDAHVRECLDCRRKMDRLRQGASRVVVMPAPAKPRINYQKWAIAATAVLMVSGAAYWGVYEFPALRGGARATVEQVEGALYKVNGGSLIPISTGAELGESDIVRTAKNSTAILRLNDGSKVEVNQMAQVYVTRSWTGSTVHLGMGNIIVAAAKQRRGSLQVVTADCNVSVKGTVFSVNAGTKGSRVAVAEGTVWVDHGEKHDILHRGDQTSTVPEVAPAPIAEQFTWSPNSAEYLALLGDLSTVTRQINAIPSPGLRYQSKLISYLPANTIVVAAIPNIGSTISEANQIFRQKLAENGALANWWNRLKPNERADFEKMIQVVTTGTQYLGNEIVLFATGTKTAPAIMAELVKPGLDTFLQSQLPAEAISRMRFDNNLFIASDAPVDLSGGFTSTALYQKMAPEYQQGAGWVFAADLATIAPELPGNTGLQDVRFVIASSKSSGNAPSDNRAAVIFAKDRSGVASWLSSPGPMGSLNFISPDAGLVIAAILKNPKSIVDDLLTKVMPGAGANASLADMANAFGGEVSVALDGPLLPVPSWKIVAEVYDPGRIQAAFTKAADEYNSLSEGRERTGDLKLTQADTNGVTYYTLKFEKLPLEANWAFVDGYWVAAATHELVVRSIQNRQTGYSLAKSDKFQSQLSRDRNTDFSALMYHNLGQTLTPILGLIGSLNMSDAQKKSVEALKVGDAGGLISFWAAPDRIDMASKGTIFGMDIPSLLAMQSGGFGSMVQGVTAAK